MSDKRDLEKQLEAMSADAARQSHLRSAADIRKRADRRRATQVVATGIATAAVVAVAWTVAAPASDDRGWVRRRLRPVRRRRLLRRPPPNHRHPTRRPAAHGVLLTRLPAAG